MRSTSLVFILAAVWVSLVAAQEPSALFRLPKHEQSTGVEQLLWPDGTPGAMDVTETQQSRNDQYYWRWVTKIQHPTLTVYRPQSNSSGAAVVICPGGGYSGLAIDHEGHDVARWLNSLGITGVVLKNRVKDYGHPAPRDDVKRALRTVRYQAKNLHVKTDQIGVMGFSAGGHLASTGGTHFDQGNPSAADPIDRESSRPDFMILAYPVISFDASIGHLGSRNNLIGKDAPEELVKEYSNETRVTAETPPTFLVHSLDDPAVKLENSLRFYRALQKHKVPARLLIYNTGGHGYGLGERGGEVATWPEQCAIWLTERGLTNR